MFEPLRFLHVADVHLDRPLESAGPLSANRKILAMDATLSAFDQMIAGAISQQVDFVLLAGNTFQESDRSLRARLHLLQGLRKLREKQISVFVLPGPLDPAEAWRAIDLPSNVTLLTSSESCDEDSAPPVAVLRDGRVIATISSRRLPRVDAGSEESPATDETAPPPDGQTRNSPFRVRLLLEWPAESESLFSDADALFRQLSAFRCDYLAVPACEGFSAGQTLNTEEGIAHNPGPLQARCVHETGPHGATLIEVDKQGKIRGTFLPYSSVRRLRIEIPVEPAASLEDLKQTMSSQLDDQTPREGENAWFVTWILKGRSGVIDALRELKARTELIDSLPQTPADAPEIFLDNQIQFSESSPLDDANHLMNDLERLYHAALESPGTDDGSLVKNVRETLRTLENADWRERLIPLAQSLDCEVVRSQARALGAEWFQGADDEE